MIRYFWIHGTLTADKNFDNDGQQQLQVCQHEDKQPQQQQGQHQEGISAPPKPAPLEPAPPASGALVVPNTAAPPEAPAAPIASGVLLLVAPPSRLPGAAIPGLAAAQPALDTAPAVSDLLAEATESTALSSPIAALAPEAPALSAPGRRAALALLDAAPAASDPPLGAVAVAVAVAVSAPGPMEYISEQPLLPRKQHSFNNVLLVDPDEEKAELELIEDDNELTEEQELQHPPAVFIPNQQLAAEKNIADTVAVVHSSPNNEAFPLMVSGTCFNLSSFHFAANNTSIPLFNNLTNPKRPRLEYVDFLRPQLHLYMWDRRHAVSLSVQSPATNRFQTRFFLAMTNLYMPLDANGELMFEDLVLLDLLYRLDPYAYIDAVVGVVATGEVILWQHSLTHLRFNYCDFHRPLKRGEAFWFSKLEQFYSERGLLYVRQRLIPRDLDAPRNRFAVSKEYITHYKHPCKTLAKVDENFKKWLLLPGKNKSKSEQSEDLAALLSRACKGNRCSDPEEQQEKTLAQIEQEEYAAKQKAKNDKRLATIQAKKVTAAATTAATTAATAAATAAATTAAGAPARRVGTTADATAGRTAGDTATRANAGAISSKQPADLLLTTGTKRSGRGQVQIN